MIDRKSKIALQHFLETLFDIDKKGYNEQGLLKDKAIKQAIKKLLDEELFTTEQITMVLAETECVVLPSCRLKKFVENGEWPNWVNLAE